MLAMTPLAINCLMMSIGLAWMRSARSRTLMLAGISMTLSPLSLISHLRVHPSDGAERAHGGISAAASPAGPRGTPGRGARGSCGQPVEDGLQLEARLRGQFRS